MAKNNYDPNNFDQQQANIRKAKGNPNKNVHQKKNGSNYKGYAAAQKEAEAAKLAKKQENNRLPMWVTITMAVIFVVLIAVLVLMNTVMKDNLIFSQVSSMIIGLSCGALFYMRRFTKSPDSKFQDILYVILAVMAVVMTFMGAYGLYRLLLA